MPWHCLRTGPFSGVFKMLQKGMFPLASRLERHAARRTGGARAAGDTSAVSNSHGRALGEAGKVIPCPGDMGGWGQGAAALWNQSCLAASELNHSWQSRLWGAQGAGSRSRGCGLVCRERAERWAKLSLTHHVQSALAWCSACRNPAVILQSGRWRGCGCPDAQGARAGDGPSAPVPVLLCLAALTLGQDRPSTP